MTDLRKAAEMALEFAEFMYGRWPFDTAEGQMAKRMSEALRQALSQPSCQTGSQCIGGKCPQCVPTYEFECPRCGHCCQQKEWVGLTEAEWYEATSIPRNATLPMHMLKAIEAKLKEKNT